MNLRSTFALFSAVTAASAGSAFAQHAGDVWLEVLDNRIVTGLIDEDEDPPVVTSGVRVFGSDFGEVLPNWTDEPGFDNELGTFQSGTSIGFNIRAALRSWNGSDFSMVPTERISVGFPTASAVLTPLTDELVAGFTIPVDMDNAWHRHLEYELLAPASTGVYLLELELFSTESSILPSLPFWLVLNQGEDEGVHDAAIDWVNQNLVPAPSTAALVIAGLAVGGRRRR
jgi:hypothetical protein